VLEKEFIPHPSYRNWILSQAAVDEISIPPHRTSNVCPALCVRLQQALPAANASKERKKEKKLVAASGHKWKLPFLGGW